MSTVGVFSKVAGGGDIICRNFNTLGGYHNTYGGYHEYCVVYSTMEALR